MASIFSQLLSRRVAQRASILAAGVGTAAAVRIAMAGVIQPEATARPQTFNKTLPQYLQLESSTEVNHNTKLLRFALPTEDAVSGLPLTSALLSITWPKGGIFPTPRPYTPVSPLDEPGHVDLLVKKYPDGKTSPYLHSLKPGDSVLFWKVPAGYKWTANQHPHVLLIAGGAGITPIYQLARGILANPEDKTKITVVFGINTDADALFQNEFREYEQKYPEQFKAIYTVTQPEENSSLRKGRVSQELLSQVLDSSQQKPTKVFVCGPPAMEEALVGGKGTSGILQQLGYSKKEVHRF